MQIPKVLPLPSTRDGWKRFNARLREVAPELADDIEALKDEFPTAKLVSFTAPNGVRLGEPEPDPAKVFNVHQHILCRVGPTGKFIDEKGKP